MEYNASALVCHELKQSTSNFPFTMESAVSEPSKYQQSNTCSPTPAMQGETELTDLRDQTSLKIKELKLQIGEAERSCYGSTVSLSLMPLPIDEKRTSDIKSWLDQTSDVMAIQKQNSQTVVKTAKKTLLSQAIQLLHEIEDNHVQ